MKGTLLRLRPIGGSYKPLLREGAPRPHPKNLVCDPHATVFPFDLDKIYEPEPFWGPCGPKKEE